MSLRLWYPQLDVYDTVRRMAILLQFFEEPPGTERLYISDFYLATPSLLHRTSMSLDTRREFGQLKIPRPEKFFVSFPAPPILFHRMEPTQRQALQELGGKGLLFAQSLDKGRVELTTLGIEMFPLSIMASAEETILGRFLTRSFSGVEDVGNRQLRLQTGLRRPS